MLRLIFGVVAGYATIVVVSILLFAFLYGGLGPERAFQPGTLEASSLWLSLALAVSVVAALAGGRVALTLGRSRQPVIVLVAVVFVLGVVSAWSGMGAQPQAVADPAGLSFAEAAVAARTPTWYAWVLPLVGAVFVWLGGGGDRRY